MYEFHERFDTKEQVAAAVAAEIRTKGHYQGQGGYDGVRSCVLANDAYILTTFEAWRDYQRALIKLVFGSEDSQGLAGWNDTHTTEEVLAVLDKIAEGVTQ